VINVKSEIKPLKKVLLHRPGKELLNLTPDTLERLLFDICDGDDKVVSEMMKELSQKGEYTLCGELHSKVTELFWGGFCDDELTKKQISDTYKETGYTLDTHTAVAVNVYEQYVKETGDNTKTVIASTASPYKFNQAVLSALGEETEGIGDFELIDILNQKSKMDIPVSLSQLKNKEKRVESVIDKADMPSLVANVLNIK